MLVANNKTFCTSKGWLILSPHYYRLDEGQLATCPHQSSSTNLPTGCLENRDLPTAWLAGATKAEAAATRREKRKKVRILIVLLDKVLLFATNITIFGVGLFVNLYAHDMLFFLSAHLIIIIPPSSLNQ